MIPRTRAGYAAALLVVVALVLNGLRAWELVAHLPADPALSLASSSAVTTALAALVYTVHLNGASR